MSHAHEIAQSQQDEPLDLDPNDDELVGIIDFTDTADLGNEEGVERDLDELPEDILDDGEEDADQDLETREDDIYDSQNQAESEEPDLDDENYAERVVFGRDPLS